MTDNFTNYVKMVIESLGWKKPTEYGKLQMDFLNDINKTAQKYGYRETMFGENDNNERLIKFSRIENE